MLGYAIRSFALAIIFLEVCWGVLLAGICFWIASDGSTARGIIAIVFAMSFVSIGAVILGFYFAALSVVRKAVSDAGIGRIIFENLFDQMLGVTGEDTGQQPDRARVPTHLSAKEVEAKLNDAARRIIPDAMPSTKWAGPFFWLAGTIQRISVWATVKVIVESCSDEGDSVNLFELRNRLASVIDDGVVSFLRQYLTRLAFTVISIVSSLAMLIALGIRQLPI